MKQVLHYKCMHGVVLNTVHSFVTVYIVLFNYIIEHVLLLLVRFYNLYTQHFYNIIKNI